MNEKYKIQISNLFHCLNNVLIIRKKALPVAGLFCGRNPIAVATSPKCIHFCINRSDAVFKFMGLSVNIKMLSCLNPEQNLEDIEVLFNMFIQYQSCILLTTRFFFNLCWIRIKERAKLQRSF